MKQITIIDTALKSQAGHHYNSAKRIEREILSLGFHGQVIAAQDADDLEFELPFRKQIVHEIYGRTDWSQDSFLRTANSISRKMPDLSQTDMVIFPTGDQIQILALALALERTPNPNLKVVAWLLFSPRVDQAPHESADQSVEFELATNRLLRHVKLENVSFFCETECLQDCYQAITPFPVHRQPSPTIVGKKRNVDGQTKVVAAGVAHSYKGYHRLLPVAKRLEKIRSVKMYVQGEFRRCNDPKAQSYLRSLTHAPNVMTIPNSLSATDYRWFIESADLILLPYSVLSCHWRGSGIFNEAEHLGIPFVATSDCHFAIPASRDQRGVISKDTSSESFADAVEEALRTLPTLTKRCHAKSLTRPQAFFSKFLKNAFVKD